MSNLVARFSEYENALVVLTLAVLLGALYILVIIAPTVLLHFYLYREYCKDFEKKKKHKFYIVYYQFEYGRSKLNLVFVSIQIVWFLMVMKVLG